MKAEGHEIDKGICTNKGGIFDEEKMVCTALFPADAAALASPVRATSYPASDIPNQVTEAGQQAIIDYFTRDGETNIPAIAALYDLNVPAAEQVDYILLYAYPHGTSYDGAYTGRVYLIEDAETIRQLCAAALPTATLR